MGASSSREEITLGSLISELDETAADDARWASQPLSAAMDTRQVAEVFSSLPKFAGTSTDLNTAAGGGGGGGGAGGVPSQTALLFGLLQAQGDRNNLRAKDLAGAAVAADADGGAADGDSDAKMMSRYLQRIQLATLRQTARAVAVAEAAALEEKVDEDDNAAEDAIPSTDEEKRAKSSALVLATTFRLSLMTVRASAGADEGFKKETCNILMDLVEQMDAPTLHLFQQSRSGKAIIKSVEGECRVPRRACGVCEVCVYVCVYVCVCV